MIIHNDTQGVILASDPQIHNETNYENNLINSPIDPPDLVQIGFCGDDVKSPAPNLVNISQPDFYAMAKYPCEGVKQGPYVVRASFLDGAKTRSDDTLAKTASTLILDCDSTIGEESKKGAPCPYKVHENLKAKGINHLIYRSYSHQTPGYGNRYRVIFITDRPYNNNELPGLVKHALSLCGEPITNVSENGVWSQAWYLPRKPDGDTNEFSNLEYSDGENVTVSEQVPTAASNVKPEQTPDTIKITPDSSVKPTTSVLSDNEIETKMRAVKNSAAVMLGDKVSNAALLDGDEVALAKAFPPKTAGEPYDRSRADMSFATRISFWACGDLEQIKRIMLASPLARPKYRQRKGKWLNKTIKTAIEICSNFYTGKIKKNIHGPVNNPYIKADELEKHFKGIVFVISENAFYVPGYTYLLKHEAFNGLFSGHIYELDPWSSPKTIRKASEAYLYNTVYKFIKASGTTYDPSLPQGSNGDVVNLFIPPEISTNDGDVSRFLNHIRKLFPEPRDQEIILSFLAYIVQNIGKKIRWCPVIIGTPGNGKSTISVIMESILGYMYCHTIKSSDLGTKGKVFNGWQLLKLFATLEEISGDRVEVQETLLTWITNLRVNVEAKGVDEKTIVNCINYIAYSNNDDAVRVTQDGRRFAVLYTAQDRKEHLIEHGLTESYFNDLYQWLNTSEAIASIAGYLKRYEIKISMNTLPISTTHHRAIEESKSNWQLDIEAAIATGEHGARGGFIIPRMIAENVPKRGVDKFMKKLGYTKCKNRARVGGVFYRAIYTNNILTSQLSGTDLARKISEIIFTGGVANFSTNKR